MRQAVAAAETAAYKTSAAYALFFASRSRACCASLIHAWAISNNLALLPGCSAARASRRQSTTCAWYSSELRKSHLPKTATEAVEPGLVPAQGLNSNQRIKAAGGNEW